jgi:hypothetical protein
MWLSSNKTDKTQNSDYHDYIICDSSSLKTLFRYQNIKSLSPEKGWIGPVKISGQVVSKCHKLFILCDE